MRSFFILLNKFNNFLDIKIKISICLLIFKLILLSFLEFISLGSIPLLISYFLDDTNFKFDFIENFINYFKNFNSTKLILLIIFIIFFIKALMLAYVNFYELKTIRNLKIYITKKLFNRYIFNDYKFYLKNNHSYLSRNLIVETDNSASLIQSVMHILRELFLLLIIFTLLFIYNPFISLMILLLLILSASIFYLSTDKILKSIATQRISAMGKIYKLPLQVFNLIKEIKILSKEQFFIKKFLSVKETYEGKIQTVDFIRRLPKIFFEILTIIVFLFLLIIFQLHNKDQFIQSIPFFSLIVVCVVKLIPSFNVISGSLTHIQSYMNSFNLIYDQINDLKYEKKFSYLKKLNSENIISLENIDFKYDFNSKSSSLQNISLNIKRGEMIGIIGKSGSGKTTLINILLGLLKPSSGKINYFSNSERFVIGHVPQDIVIFDETLQNNIAFGIDEKNINKEKIYNVIKFSGLEDFFKKNNSDINMLLGDKGINISGGERQRIGIARSLYFDPDIIIFDEATSSLDINTEKHIIDEINKIKGKVTSIFVSHRLSALKNCDRAILVEKGKIISTGSIDEMIKDFPNFTNEK